MKNMGCAPGNMGGGEDCSLSRFTIFLKFYHSVPLGIILHQTLWELTSGKGSEIDKSLSTWIFYCSSLPPPTPSHPTPPPRLPLLPLLPSLRLFFFSTPSRLTTLFKCSRVAAFAIDYLDREIEIVAFLSFQFFFSFKDVRMCVSSFGSLWCMGNLKHQSQLCNEIGAAQNQT